MDTHTVPTPPPDEADSDRVGLCPHYGGRLRECPICTGIDS